MAKEMTKYLGLVRLGSVKFMTEWNDTDMLQPTLDVTEVMFYNLQ